MSTGRTHRSSPKACGDIAATDSAEKPVDPLHVSSERELAKEIEKVAGMLSPEQDWSVRIAAMQRVEALVAGGAAEHACFPSLLKNLGGPLCQQLSDRRSSIVKQACHLLNLLSRELRSDFEYLAESFIPVLFKLVVITVLVIAESADNCIRTLLRNCRVSRILPRIADCAKSDRSAVLRARCCEYALLVLERWGESPDIQRLADQYEDLIKCCVGDAVGEVRSIARSCFRLFSKTWPDRSRRLFSLFDPSIQKLISEEDGGSTKRYASPTVRDRHQRPTPIHPAATQPAVLPGLPTADENLQAAVPKKTFVQEFKEKLQDTKVTNQKQYENPEWKQEKRTAASGKRPPDHLTDNHLDSVLLASQQQVSAIETMLKGLDMPDKSIVSTTSRFIGKDPAGGSYRKIHAPLVAAARVAVDPPSARDPPYPATTTQSNYMRTSVNMPNLRGSDELPTLIPAAVSENKRPPGGVRDGMTCSRAPFATPSRRDTATQNQLPEAGRVVRDTAAPASAKRVPMTADRSSQTSTSNELQSGPKRVPKTEEKCLQENLVPGFQRPLMKSTISGRSSVSSRSSMEDLQAAVATSTEPCVDGLMSLADVLNEGLSHNADWSARVAAFSYMRKLLQNGPRGLQEVNQNFDKIMRLLHEHLADPHHKVAQAALSAFSELVPACRKAFEAYLERLLPRVFSRLTDTKEVIRQLGTSALEVVGNAYTVDALLPALLRSLDEQRSPKAKMAVIEFAIAAFAKLALSGEGTGGGMLKVWLAKLAPLANDKNPKLKETAVTGIISVYSHFDSATVLNFILSLSIEEQSMLRRALKHYTPRIEVDLMTHLQSRNQRGRPRTENPEKLGSKSQQQSGETGVKPDYGTSRPDRDLSPSKAAVQQGNGLLSFSEEEPAVYLSSGEVHDSAMDSLRSVAGDSTNAAGDLNSYEHESQLTSVNDLLKYQGSYESMYEEKAMHRSKASFRMQEPPSSRLMQKFVNWHEETVEEKCEALRELLQSRSSDVWSQSSNQVLSSSLDAVDDPNSGLRELALSVIPELLSQQKGTVDASLELVIQKLVAAATDHSVKVSTLADRCLSAILAMCDPQRCLYVLVPMLASKDDKTLVTCISCLTKLVTRLPQDVLMSQLPSFLPALFDAFGNQNADVRKTVVFCLVDIYIVLGKSFVPYLGSLSSTQLRLVTIYANRISQARTGATLEQQ